ncbi:MAG: GDP-mannose 4,6-dehydratase [Candidatus Sericytochromatia bacterium]|nr:MAG: GDP-mannose 4,6-dehydratase [Candidatus Sericytochromatia bacterium]
MKKALITGINGQDGSYLAEFLLEKGYQVHGIVRRSSIENASKLYNLKNILDKIYLHSCNIENQLSVYKIISEIKPDECYHLAAFSFVSYSFDDETNIISTNFNSTHFLLSSIKELVPECKFYFAGSSEMFGNTDESPQNENTKFNPRSIYGISKLSSYYLVKNYRERFGLFCCTGIAYNHESPRRDYSFVTRKISSGISKILRKEIDRIELGNINAIRDWGYAPDYVKAMWLMLNKNDKAEDFIISTGIGHTVEDLLKIAFDYINKDYREYIHINSNFFRESEKTPLIGDNSKIKNKLNWENTKNIKDIIIEMIENDIKQNKI